MTICHPYGHLRGNLMGNVVGNTESSAGTDSKLDALEFTTGLKMLSAVMTNIAMSREVVFIGWLRL